MYTNYQWINPLKSRYYKISVNVNGVDNISLCHHWGGCNSNRGGKKNLVFNTKDDARKYLTQMMKRRKRRGYELIGS